MADQPSKAAKSQSVRNILYVLGLLGAVGTWGRAVADGTLVHLFNALHGADEYILPGTKTVLRKSFTGIYWPTDYLLNVLVIFFWEAVDGSHPATSAIGIYFLGQLFAIVVAFYTDCLRAGHGLGSSLIKSVLHFWLSRCPLIPANTDLRSGCSRFRCAVSVALASSGR